MKTQIYKILPLWLALTALVLGFLILPSAQAQTWATNSPLQVARWAHTATWQTNSTVSGDGTVKIISMPYSIFSPAKQDFIRVSTQ